MKNRRWLSVFLGAYLAFHPGVHAQTLPEWVHYEHWADSVLNTLTLEKKIGQLFMVAAYSNRNQNHKKEILDLIKKNHIGGLIFFQGGPVRQSILLTEYQAASEIPLWIGMDAEWGVGMRLDSTIRFPYQMALGAIQKEELLYSMGEEIARQFQLLGMHVNFAPVVDINNNPLNPVINFRSFGENRENVTRKALQYMRGMQDNRILASLKHFPGHGDTQTDSHLDLPVITHTYNRLDSLEFYPYKIMIGENAGSLMVSHLNIPALDPTINLPATLSRSIVTGLIRDTLNFKGLVFTDALNMKGVTKYFQPGEVDLKALQAGNEVLLFSENVPKAIELIREEVKKGRIKEETIHRAARKVLLAKAWTNADKANTIDTDHLVSQLNTPAAQVLLKKLTASSFTLIRNQNNLIPLMELDTLEMATVTIGQAEDNILQDRFSDYMEMDHFFVDDDMDPGPLLENLKKYDYVQLAVRGLSQNAGRNFGLKDTSVGLIQNLISQNKVILLWFGNPYGLTRIGNFSSAASVLVTYQDNSLIAGLVPQAIFGAEPISGKLPVTINSEFPSGTGITTEGGLRLSYGWPEEVSLNGTFLEHQIDSLAAYALNEKVAPGIQILVARHGKVIFHKTYGNTTYEKLDPVRKDHLYDFASVTKITTSLPSIMKLHDENRLDLEGKLGDYLPYFRRGDKKDLTFRRMLTHSAGLHSWIAFYQFTKKPNGKYKNRTLAAEYSPDYPIRLTDQLYEHKDYKQKIYKMIRKSPVDPSKGYEYSDLSFILYPDVVTGITGVSFEEYLKTNFYRPLGAGSLTYNPMRFYDLNRVIPTENDNFFRMTQLHGVVHDEGAAMLDGVSGHAGLFGTANDLAKLMQMYLNGGSYGGEQYITSATLKKFSVCQYCQEGVRRAIGFDRPVPGHPEDGNCAKDAGDNSFGHSGYTGTFTWVDPDTGILFVFFSNRVYPTRNNNKISELNIRPLIHQAIYEARTDE